MNSAPSGKRCIRKKGADPNTVIADGLGEGSWTARPGCVRRSSLYGVLHRKQPAARHFRSWAAREGAAFAVYGQFPLNSAAAAWSVSRLRRARVGPDTLHVELALGARATAAALPAPAASTSLDAGREHRAA